MTENIEKPTLTVDVVLFHTEEDPENTEEDEVQVYILLIKRKYDPFKESWALPGGHVEVDEALEDAAVRELVEETGVSIEKSQLYQIGAFGNPGRDPRGRVLSVAFLALSMGDFPEIKGADDALEARWFKVDEDDNRFGMPTLAFDHMDIIMKAIKGS